MKAEINAKGLSFIEIQPLIDDEVNSQNIPTMDLIQKFKDGYERLINLISKK